MKGGNGFFKQAINELLTTQHSVAQVLQKLTMQNLRAILRREHTNMEKKVQLILMIVNMYRLLVAEFYPMCAQNVVKEACSFYGEAKQVEVYNSLI